MKKIFLKEIFPTITITAPCQRTDESSNSDYSELQQASFNLFADKFGKCLVRGDKWKNTFLRGVNISFSDVISYSDEGFAIFTIERNWDIWKQEVDTGEKVKLRSGAYTQRNTNVKYGGWTQEGMDRFKEICKSVVMVRKTKNSKRKELEVNFKQTKEDQTISNIGSNNAYVTTVEKETNKNNICVI
jgi:hypothetical protein